jgi:hypothetical protein
METETEVNVCSQPNTNRGLISRRVVEICPYASSPATDHSASEYSCSTPPPFH